MQGTLFGFSQPKTNVWIHFLNPILKLALVKLGTVPARSMEELEIEGESQTLLHDGTERPIQRPKDEEQQKEFYSGKKRPYVKEYSAF